MNPLRPSLLLCAALIVPPLAHAQLVISDTLTGASSSYGWKAINGACLTAGDNSGSIPACIGNPYYAGKTQVGGNTGRLPDAVGKGALRLTNGDTQLGGGNGNYQNGSVVSTMPFPATQGVEVTFTTVSYGGNGFGGTGADGISFYLTDGNSAPDVGSFGGSLGYSCSISGSNPPFNGVLGGYLGVGIDEYGNFSNPSDNTATGPGPLPGSITVRGAGNVNWTSLSATYPQLYPPALGPANRQTAVWNTCHTGTLYNASASVQTVNGNTIQPGQSSTIAVMDYPFLSTSKLPGNVTIANQQGVNYPLRSMAMPITYALSITQGGLLNLAYSVNGGPTVPVITNQSIAASNGAVPASFRFGFAASTGSGSNVHEITCFKAAQLNAAANSAGVNVQQSAQVQAGTQLYLAYFHPANWWGQLTATDLVYNTTSGTVSYSTLANWDASCVLTGGACTTTGGSNSATAPASRVMMSWDGNKGVALKWTDLSPAQQQALVDPTHLDYLRGERSQEITPSLPTGLRARSNVLGDIMNSSPTWVGPPAFAYNGPWKDAIYVNASMPEGSSYTAFATSKAQRSNVVYVGANDGLLHGFRAGSYQGGVYDATNNDGKEVIAYMPAAVSATIVNPTANLDFTSPNYVHAVFVDATPGTGDLFYANAWHTWLVGGLGAGSNKNGPINHAQTQADNSSIFVLDITDPSSFSEANAANLVLGDWGPNTLPNCGGSPSNCKDYLGNTYGTPLIRRLHDGNWAVIFGNGLNSDQGNAGIFVVSVDQASGAMSFRFLDTGYGPSKDPQGTGARNGITHVASADLDGDHVTDYVYAGDVFGNLWRFDLTSSNPAQWAAANKPLFSTPAGQPITTAVTVSATQQPTGPSRVMVNFGTGQRLPQTATAAATFASGTQYLYGIWDWDMAHWNAKNSIQYLSLTGPQVIGINALQAQTATNVNGSGQNISGFRTVTAYPICWKGKTACASNTQFGWKLALPSATEQVIYNPTTAYGLFVVNTTVPAANNVLTCASAPATGYTMAIAIDTGASPPSSFFADATNNFMSSNGSVVSGIGLSATGTPSFVTANGKTYTVDQTSTGVGSVTQVNPGANGIGKRVNWIKLR